LTKGPEYGRKIVMNERITPEPMQDHQFWDPKRQEVPEMVFDVPTDRIANLCEAAGHLAVLIPYSHKTYPYTHAAYTASRYYKDALALAPLVERVHAGEELDAQDVRPYRKSIKRLVPLRVRNLDRLTMLLSPVGVGIPLRRALNRRVEQEFIDRAPGLAEEGLAKVRANIEVLEPHVAFLEQFDNPREQAQAEFRFLINGIKRHTAEVSPNRLSSRSAAEGIRREINEIFSSQENKSILPLISYSVLDRMKKQPKVPEQEILEIAAPEIMNVLYSALPRSEHDREFVAQLKANSHPKRSLATAFSSKLESFERGGIGAVSGLIYAMPTSGAKIRQMYERVKDYIEE